MILMFNNYQDK